MEVSEAPLANGLAGFGSLEPVLTNGNGFTNGHADPPLDLGAQLASELPEVLNDLIPLSFIVERVVGQAYAELANLAEMCVRRQADGEAEELTPGRLPVFHRLRMRRGSARLWTTCCRQEGKFLSCWYWCGGVQRRIPWGSAW